jgi:hypothetical protein
VAHSAVVLLGYPLMTPSMALAAVWPVEVFWDEAVAVASKATLVSAGLVTDQVKLADPVERVESVAVRVTVYVPPALGVPVIWPVVVLMDRPGGKPVADHELIVAVVDESTATGVVPVMAVPTVELCVPGAVTVTVLVGSEPESTFTVT